MPPDGTDFTRNTCGWPDGPAIFSWRRLGEHDPSLHLPQKLRRACTRRQNEYLAGRCAARQSIRALSGQALTPKLSEHRAPVWPDGFVGSISHAGGMAVALVGRQSDYLGIGVDIEPQLDANKAAMMASQILTASERRNMIDTDHVTLAFSAKESLFKALHPLTHVWFGFEDAVVVAYSPNGTGVLRLCRNLGSGWDQGRCLPFWHGRFNGLVLTRVDIRAT